MGEEVNASEKDTIRTGINKYLSLVTFSHTIFAMPFAMIGFTMGVVKMDNFDPMILVKVILCMIFARSAAMAFNRYLDRDIDAINPRTKQREIPSGKITERSALLFVLLNCLAFALTTFFINELCFFLSPIALAVILGYSYTKRFTALCHYVLGVGLGLAPVGAYLAVTASFDWIPVIIGLTVLTWVAGFDIIYSLQDDAFDQEHKLHSIPALVGRKNALRISTISHIMSGFGMIITLILMRRDYPQVNLLGYIGAAIFLAMLIYQHTLVSENNLKRVNLAFMTTNGIASVVFGSMVILDFFI